MWIDMEFISDFLKQIDLDLNVQHISFKALVNSMVNGELVILRPSGPQM